MTEPIHVLFLCTGNSCRSQMAEGWAHHLHPGTIRAYSAGIEQHGLNPRAVKVMAEAGVDISAHQSKTVHELGDVSFDYVVTVCDHAKATCPVLPGKAQVVPISFEDPAKAEGSEEEVLPLFRRVRDEIRQMVDRLPDLLADGNRGGA